MMVLWRATPVASLAISRPQDINLTSCGHGLQRAVHRREPYVRARLAQSCVDLLSAAELVDGVEQILYCPALTGRPLRGWRGLLVCHGATTRRLGGRRLVTPVMTAVTAN